MGILKRVKHVVLADLHDMIDKCEDPIRMTKQYIRELEEQIEKAQQALAQQFMLEQKYERLIADANEMIEKRARQAKLAVEKNEEPIAKMALQEKIAYEKKLELYTQQYNTLKEKTTVLTEKVKQLYETYEQLRVKQMQLMTRFYVAETMKQIDESITSFRYDHVVKGFARMEEKVMFLEAEAKARSVMQTIPPQSFDAEVEQQLKQLKKE
ncbi:PspA/IM30 family protein [Anoxybacillus sp. D401a]|uniref:PspA/IM30 family protein n=1 Tax=Anoxybacillus sp. D401a TaxID=575112 RepID=UPI003D345A5C